MVTVNAEPILARLNNLVREPDYLHPGEDWLSGAYEALDIVIEEIAKQTKNKEEI